MKRRFLLMGFMVLIMLTAGCSSHKQFHSTDMPDPQAFNAHFGGMDTSGDGLVSWEEFESYFDNAEQKVFDAVDLNQDGSVDHDEWHAFKAAHGLKHHE
jgi:Ca2+-binding EF-hand superfamily protein